MISWRLWQSISTPFVAHPIYWQRGIWKPRPVRPPTTVWLKIGRDVNRYLEFWLAVLIVVNIIIAVTISPTLPVMIFLGIPIILMFALPPLYLLTVGSLYGLSCALAISDSIAIEKQQGRYALMGLTPHGIVGATWALGTLVQNTNELLRWMRNVLTLIYMAIGGLIGLPLLVVMFTYLTSLNPITATNDPFAFSLLNLTIILCMPMIDYVQSTNVGCLIGMIAPTLTFGRANTRGYTLFIFLSVQFGVYLVAALLCFVIWPRAYVMMGWSLNLSYSVVCVATFYLLRELVTIILWVYLAHCLETDLAEMNDATNVQIKSFDALDLVRRRFSRRAG